MPNDDYLQHVIDLLGRIDELGKIDAQAMFGGHGLYSRGQFFAIVFKGGLYFKVDRFSEQRYIDADCEPFRPSPSLVVKTYYEVPADVLENRDKLSEWAQLAVKSADPKASLRHSAVTRKRMKDSGNFGGRKPGKVKKKGGKKTAAETKKQKRK